MKLTATRLALLTSKVNGTKHNLQSNHEVAAEQWLLARKLIEYYSFEGMVCGEIKTCWDTRATEAGKKLIG